MIVATVSDSLSQMQNHAFLEFQRSKILKNTPSSFLTSSFSAEGLSNLNSLQGSIED